MRLAVSEIAQRPAFELRMTPVFVSIQRLTAITLNKFVKEFFRQAGERVYIAIVVPTNVIALLSITSNGRSPKFVIFGPRLIRIDWYLVRVEIQLIVLSEYITIEEDVDRWSTPT